MKKIFIPLFWKFAMSIILIVTIFGTINLVFIRGNVTLSLKEESDKRVRYIAKNLASQSVVPLLYGDYITLQRLVSEIKHNDSGVAYAFILAKKENVILHNFSDGIPLKLISANVLSEDQEESVVMLTDTDSDKGVIRDIALPILDGEVGIVRVGIYESHIQRESRRILNLLLIMVGVFLIIGIVSAFLFSIIITKPIKNISNFADKLDFESLKHEILPNIKPATKLWGIVPKLFHTQDELYFLAQRFNEMVTRLIKAYKELETTYEKFVETEKLASIGMLAAGVAHEINNPIAGLQNCIRRIQKHPNNYTQNEVYIDMMSEATDRIENVVQALLHYSRKPDVYIEQVQISEVIQKSLLLIEYKISVQHIEIINNISADLPTISGSGNKLEQVFVNMFMNSIDAISKKSESDNKFKKIISIDSEIAENKLKIVIEDSGTGIDKKHIKSVFEPFFTTKEIGKGTGLGLSVCMNIIDLHGGSIKLESSVNVGTKFIITFPVNQT